MRPHWIGCVALTIALVACTEVVNCSPCGQPLHIDVTTLPAGATGYRVCLDGKCAPLALLPKPIPTPPHAQGVSVGTEVFNASDVTFEVYRGKQFLASYSAPIDIRRPEKEKGKPCAPCASLRLAPSKDGTLVEQR